MSVFGTARWDTDIWGGKRDRPGAGWGDAWRVWYQVGPTVTQDLTEMTVEIRWTTDSHTTGDGTFRGDIQPGKASVRFWDPDHTLDSLDKMGAVWASYTPTGATWCWFYDSAQRALVAYPDPSGADVVFSGLTWPLRLTSPNSYLTFPSQSINARLSAVIGAMQAKTELVLPSVALVQDPAGQLVTAATMGDPNDWAPNYGSYLDAVRAAAANGVAWWQYGRDASGAGTLTLRYTDWEKRTARTVDQSQVVAGVPATQSIEWLVTNARFLATKGDTGNQTEHMRQSTQSDKYGQTRMDMRLWGDVTGGGSPEFSGTDVTLSNILNYRGDPTYPALSNVNAQSGDRWTPAGKPSSKAWDPTCHVFAPNETFNMNQANYQEYWVAKSDHTLNAAAWTTTHTLDRYIPAGALP